jgi:hypothetical protein
VSEFPLNAVQRWMQAVIVHPQGVSAGLAAEDAQQHLQLPPPDVSQLIPSSPSQSSIERLAVYANAYYARLIECLESEFPVFRQTVGEETFAEFAADYVQHYPSQSYSLGHLGDNFPRYLEKTKPVDDAEFSQPSWADFLVELASLERTFGDVFDGPGLENQMALRAADLQSIYPERWSSARLEFAPCFRLLSLQFPLNDFYSAVRSGQSPERPEPSNSWLAVTRRDFIVRRYDLTELQFLLLAELRAGKTIGAAIESAAETYSGETATLAADIRDWFQRWAAAPFFSGVQFDD